MEHWTVFSLAFAAVVVHAWLCRREDPHWYLGCIVPLLYGGAAAVIFANALNIIRLHFLWISMDHSLDTRRQT